MAEPETVRTSKDRARIAEALAYFRPHALTKGPVILTADTMREHLAVLEAALRDDPAARIAGAYEAGQREMREAAAICADQWSKPGIAKIVAGELTPQEFQIAVLVAQGIASAIRSQGPQSAETDGGRDA